MRDRDAASLLRDVCDEVRPWTHGIVVDVWSPERDLFPAHVSVLREALAGVCRSLVGRLGAGDRLWLSALGGEGDRDPCVFFTVEDDGAAIPHEEWTESWVPSLDGSGGPHAPDWRIDELRASGATIFMATGRAGTTVTVMVPSASV